MLSLHRCCSVDSSVNLLPKRTDFKIKTAFIDSEGSIEELTPQCRWGNKHFEYRHVDTNDKAFQNFIQKTFPPMPDESSATTKKQNSTSKSHPKVEHHTVQHSAPKITPSPKTGENTKKVCSSKPGKPAKAAAKLETKAEETKSKELKTTLLTKLKNVWLVKSVMNRLAEIIQGYLNPPYSKKKDHSPLHREKTDSSPLHTKKPDCSPLHTKKPDCSPLHTKKPDCSPLHTKKPDCSPLHTKKPDCSPLHTKKPDCSPLHTKKPVYSRCPNSSKMRFYHTPYLIG